MFEQRAWPASDRVLRIARRWDRCSVLGPGLRAVIWVQGCPLRCPGCVSPETLPFTGGVEVEVEALAAEIAALPDIQGVTFSGGEPMSQAAALSALIDGVRARRDLSFMAYTGLPLPHLLRTADDAQRALLARLDILVDGPYLKARHTDLRWRGSDNQCVHFLSPRHRHLAPMTEDRGQWLELDVDEDGAFGWAGIPPAGFREAFEGALRDRGFDLRTVGGDRR